MEYGLKGLVINYGDGGGGCYKTVGVCALGGGASEVLPLHIQKRGGRTGFSHAEGGHSIVLTRELEILAILKVGAQQVSTLKKGLAKSVLPAIL